MIAFTLLFDSLPHSQGGRRQYAELLEPSRWSRGSHHRAQRRHARLESGTARLYFTKQRTW
jgi:hypothetical protein